MKILIIKTSSLGDTIHTLPAITEIAKNNPAATITWAVEPAFAEVPSWHPAVTNIIHAPIRKIRQNPFSKTSRQQLKLLIKQLRQEQFDLIIDAQGLLKSVLMTVIATGTSYGLCKNSAREPISSLFYNKKITITKNMHAVNRTKELCAKACGYIAQPNIDYGINYNSSPRKPYVILFHCTTWQNKHYPNEHWQTLIQLISATNIDVLLPWGNETERQRALALAATSSATVLPKTSLTELKDIIAAAQGAIGLDTGLSHLAAATATPCVAIYGPTNPDLTKNIGHAQIQIKGTTDCAPCMQKKCYNSQQQQCMQQISPHTVWQHLQQLWQEYS